MVCRSRAAGFRWNTAGFLILVLALHLRPGACLRAAEWHTEKGFRWAELAAPNTGKPGFKALEPTATGLVFTNELDEASGAANRVLYNGAGVAVGDYDQDGRPDIFLCNLSGKNALYRNLGGWRFQDVTAAAGLGTVIPHTRGATFADINGDGFPDLLITATGRGALCFLNDGHGKFVDVTDAAGTSSRYGSTTLALADVDGNSTLDLYVTNYRPDDIRDRGRASVSMVNGRPLMAGAETNRFQMLNGQLAECGQPDQLLLNDGAGHFRPVSWTGGTFLDEDGKPLREVPLDWGLTATFRDVNGDLAPDLYVCNDYWTPDRFWINDGKGHFRAIPKLALRKTSASSMSVDFADIDRDGYPDFFMVDMLSRYPQLRKRQGFAQMLMANPIGAIDNRPQVMRNTLFLNRHDGTYAEIAPFAQLEGSDWSWAPLFLDIDLDGYPDLLIGAGHFRDVQDYDAEDAVRARQHAWTGFRSESERQAAFSKELMEHYHLYPLLRMPIGGFRNRADCTFEEVTDQWGLNQPGVHQGLALGDFDGDGDLDVVVNNLNGPAILLRNEAVAGRVAVRLKGRAPNTQAIGAQVTLIHGAVERQSSEVVCGGHYQSGSDTELVFASGAATQGMELEVHWRSGSKTVIAGVQANRLYEIDEAQSEPSPQPSAAKVSPVFEDASALLGHSHHQVAFDDYERQPLLPFKLSQLGPGTAWFDLDGDGHEDLIIGTGRGGQLAWFRSDGKGQFTPGNSDSLITLSNDTAGLVGWVNPAGGRGVLAGVTGYEEKTDRGALSFGVQGGKLLAGAAFPPGQASGGALALGDMNGDGRLVVFVAGGAVPGKYPVGAPCRVYRLEGAEWKPDERNSRVVENVGIVNGAVWSDLDGDGLPELILACEWGPVRVFRNRGGALYEITKELGLDGWSGWWRGVTTGDLNNDGKMDIIVSNWGHNSPYRATDKEPLIFLYGQLAQPGITDILETEYDHGVLVPTRQLASLAASLPFLRGEFATHKAYSEATLQQVLGERQVLARRVSATTLSSMVFLNQGNSFKAVPLPREAQFAPAFSVNVADFDGDGNEDIFLSQNFFDLQPEIARIDAGLGLWLRGAGNGQCEVVPASRSGVRVNGEQRGAAVADYDEDGRVDLVVSQNGAATRLFHNVGAKPGLRVRLRGTAGNPDGINAVVRLQYKDSQGPAREIHAGSGYWSQDSLVQVMATSKPPEGVWVRWPGGKVTTTPVPANAREVTIDQDGKCILGK
jgi:enediyne biosynthesis protein E4